MKPSSPSSVRSNRNKVYMGELCEMVNRRERAVKYWMERNQLPEHLLPQRDSRNRRVWTRAQAEEIVEWSRSRLPVLHETQEGWDRAIAKERMGHKFSRKQVVKIGGLVSRSFSREQICEAMFAEVTYTTTDAFDKAVVSACKFHGFAVPPRYLTRHDLIGALAMQRYGSTLQTIVNALYRRTGYTAHVELEGDLVRAFDLRDWELPRSDPNEPWKGKLTARQQAEIRQLERKLKAVERLLDDN